MGEQGSYGCQAGLPLIFIVSFRELASEVVVFVVLAALSESRSGVQFNVGRSWRHASPPFSPLVGDLGFVADCGLRLGPGFCRVLPEFPDLSC